MYLLLLCLLFGAGAFAAPLADLVFELPGVNYQLNFDQYSGYLLGTYGRKLHYWFTESQGDRTVDPLLLWLNGGPGCSSLMGLLTELGPFRVADDGSGTLIDNPYSWNTFANVLFLESPACVGFSYDDFDNCATKDTEVAEMNYLALQTFFAKFPEYRDRDFYITGESYAGIYVPTLAMKVMEGQATYPINLKGYAIGNGLLSYENNDNSLVFFGYYHALFGQEHWDSLVSSCCVNGVEGKDTCDFHTYVSLPCETSVLQAFEIIYLSGLNEYNLYGDCIHSGSSLSKSSQYNRAMDNLFRKLPNRPEPYSDPPCTNASAERAYLNSPEVKTALHIATEANDWDICSDEVASLYVRDFTASTPFIASLQAWGIRGLIYNGDVDMACNFLGNEWDVGTLGLTELGSRNKWTVGGQVAGYVDQFENLDFVTIRGSGHMVPEDKPEEALHMIKSFVYGQPY